MCLDSAVTSTDVLDGADKDVGRHEGHSEDIGVRLGCSDCHVPDRVRLYQAKSRTH